MKATLTSLIIIGLLFAGCKKESPKAKTYQLNSITYTDGGVNTNVLFVYDDQGRLSGYNDTRSGGRYKYTYGADGNVSSADVIDNYTSQIMQTNKVTYSANTINISGPNFNFTFNDKKQLIKADSYDNNYVTFTYNDAGDIIKTIQYDADGAVVYTNTFTYDNNPNPLHALAAKNVHFGAFSDAVAAFSVHNIITRSNTIITNNYKYLDNGLPYSIVAVSSDGAASTYATYNYTTK